MRAAPAARDSNVAAVLTGIDDLRALAPFYWYDERDVRYRHVYRQGSPFTAPLRSGWYVYQRRRTRQSTVG